MQFLQVSLFDPFSPFVCFILVPTAVPKPLSSPPSLSKIPQCDFPNPEQMGFAALAVFSLGNTYVSDYVFSYITLFFLWSITLISLEMSWELPAVENRQDPLLTW